MKHLETNNYRHLFVENVPLLDVRAPVESLHGSFPNAENRFLLDDSQRVLVGTAYKQQGKETAIALGHRLATAEVRQARLHSWLEFVRRHPDGFLFCLRGGMRSQIAQDWLEQVGITYPRVTGGYKAMRSYLLESITQSCAKVDFWVVSGRTGTGKTHLLPRLPCHMDLEKLAGHRGSSFGKRVEEQPSQANFEHQLAIELLRHEHVRNGCIAVEDESRLIGRRSIPEAFFQKMKCAPIVVLESSKKVRVKQIVEDYVHTSSLEYREALGEDLGWQRFSEVLHMSLRNIRRRLGDKRYGAISGTLTEALAAFRKHQELDGFHKVVGTLLEQYYDLLKLGLVKF